MSIKLQLPKLTDLKPRISVIGVGGPGCNGIQRFLERSPPPADSDEMRILQVKLAALYSLFMISHVEPGLGVEFQDIFSGWTYPLIDVNYRLTAELPGPTTMRSAPLCSVTCTAGADRTRER